MGPCVSTSDKKAMAGKDRYDPEREEALVR